MSTIYDQHDAAFSAVEAFAILKDGEHVANVKMKHGAAVTAYVHWIGTEMVRGRAGGGGYDKRTVAMQWAADKVLNKVDPTIPGQARAFFSAIVTDNGSGWERLLERAGFTVLRVI